MNIVLSVRSVTRVLLAVAGALVLASALGQFSRLVLGHGRLLGFVRLFDVNQESNLPAYFSTLLIAVASGLCLVTALHHRRTDAPSGRHWAALAAVLAVLSIDESVQLHESVGIVIADRFGAPASGPFAFVWVVPALVAVLVLGAAFLRFVLALPATTRLRVVVSGATYVTGALGMEMVGGAWSSAHGQDNLAYAGVVTVEESLEMAGMILLVRALLLYLAASTDAIRLTFLAGAGPGAVPAARRPAVHEYDA